MGLDMYLYKETYIGNNWRKEDEQAKFAAAPDSNGARVKQERISTIKEVVGYWRKANQIHAWFVANVQDGVDECRETSVSLDKLKELLSLVDQVLESPEMGPELLPTQSGFFFGDTEYSEYYIEDLKLTKQILEAVIAEDEDDDYSYRSSW